MADRPTQRADEIPEDFAERLMAWRVEGAENDVEKVICGDAYASVIAIYRVSQLIAERDARIEALEDELTNAGFRKSADEKLWVPPVNEVAGRLHRENAALRTCQHCGHEDYFLCGECNEVQQQ